jgi:hypothetical protein
MTCRINTSPAPSHPPYTPHAECRPALKAVEIFHDRDTACRGRGLVAPARALTPPHLPSECCRRGSTAGGEHGGRYGPCNDDSGIADARCSWRRRRRVAEGCCCASVARGCQESAGGARVRGESCSMPECCQGMRPAQAPPRGNRSLAAGEDACDLGRRAHSNGSQSSTVVAPAHWSPLAFPQMGLRAGHPRRRSDDPGVGKSVQVGLSRRTPARLPHHSTRQRRALHFPSLWYVP